MLESGVYLAKSKQKRGESTRLETFDFLGFTFYCGQTRKGTAWMMPKTGSKKFRQKLKDIKVWLYANRDQKLKKLMGMLNLKLTGHYRYYGVSFNGRMISNFKQQVREMLFKVVTMPPAAAQMMMKAVDFLLLVPYPSDLLYPYSGDTSTLQSTL